MKLLFGVVILFSLKSYAGVGFQAGSQLEVTPLDGIAYAYCTDEFQRRVYRSFRCLGEEVKPGVSDYFVNDSGVSANKVKLDCTQSDGRRVSKISRFESDMGRTKRRVNLWIHTLAQRPLLDVGKNKITYKMLKGREVVEEGDFEVEVNVNPTLYCQPMTLNFNYSCSNRASICNDYFYFNTSCN